MKVIASILSLLIATGLYLRGTMVMVFQTPSQSPGLVGLGLGALTILIYGPLLLGSLTAYWNFSTTTESRRYFRWWLWIIVGLEILAAAGVAIYAVAAGSAVWLPIVFIGGGIVLLVAALVIGPALRRNDEARNPINNSWTPIGRRDSQRKFASVAATFVATFVLGMIVFVVVLGAMTQNFPNKGVQLLFVTEFSFLAAACACIVVSLPLNRQIRDSAGRDVGLLRKIAKVVLRGKELPLDDEEQRAAAKYAAVISIALPFQLSYLALLYTALVIQQLVSVTTGQTIAIPVGIIVLLVVTLAISFPLFSRRVNRARRYSKDHAHLLPEGNNAHISTAGNPEEA